jgi:hypothetical protein
VTLPPSPTDNGISVATGAPATDTGLGGPGTSLTSVWIIR